METTGVAVNRVGMHQVTADANIAVETADGLTAEMAVEILETEVSTAEVNNGDATETAKATAEEIISPEAVADTMAITECITAEAGVGAVVEVITPVIAMAVAGVEIISPAEDTEEDIVADN